MQLVKYDAACRAVAEAKTVDEVKHITSAAEAARAYARQSKNKQLELDAVEIRVRAERRLGELILTMKSERVIRVGGPGRGRKDSPLVTLKDLGIDSEESGGAQRLAKLSNDAFEKRIDDWRDRPQNRTGSITMPLQDVRRPAIPGQHQRQAFRSGSRVESGDPLDRFRVDGRRVADWRFGELRRIQDLANRTLHAVDALILGMPIANPEPLDTMETIFRSEELHEILAPIWDAPVNPGETGINSERIRLARAARADKYRRRCKNCNSEFIMRRPSGKAMAGLVNEGQFCCRDCAFSYRKRECGT